MVIIQNIRVRNRRRFQFGIDQLPRLISFDNPLGEALPEQKFWHFCVGADHDDEPYGRGLAHWLYWLTWFKRNDLKWWITFLENFADPSTVGTYPAGSTNAEKATLEGAVRSLGKSKWAIKPEGMLVELVEASRSGTADYEAMYKTINEAISQVILSQNMTTESGSSESQARVHQDVGDSVIESDDALISGSFNDGPVKWLTEWNFPGAAIPIVQRKLEPEEDLKASAERDKIIVDMGFPANPEYIVEKYGEGFKSVGSEAKPISLNPGELTAFISLISQAQQGGWSPDMVRISLQISFPHVSDALLDKMAASMKGVAAPGADPNNPQSPAPDTQTPEQSAQSLDDVAAQFAKKKCSKGISCGDSCIAAGKICTKHLSPERQQQVKNIRDRAKKGDAIAQDMLDRLRDRPSREASLVEFESATFKNTFESALGITENGDPVFKKKGEQGHVSFTAEEVESIRGGTLSHNHPNYLMYSKDDPRSDGNTFSPADIKFAAIADLREIRAVSGKYLHSISKPANGWPTVSIIEIAIATIKCSDLQ